jgi:hypothetical protein
VLIIRDLLPFLYKAISGGKDEFIVYILSVIKIKCLNLKESYDDKIVESKGKGKGRAKKPRLFSSSYEIPTPKKSRLHLLLKQEEESDLEVSQSYDSLY